MKIKVCGIRDQSNLNFLEQSSVDWIGFIFYDKSKRYFGDGTLQASDLQACQKQKVGVFVNATHSEILSTAQQYQLDMIQLHGDESPADCRKLFEKKRTVIKAFGIQDRLPENLAAYAPVVDYFLFDTGGGNYGGHGRSFDWKVLDHYTLPQPFILSGGIGPGDVEKIKKWHHPQLKAIDVNSRFEISPGVKNEEELQIFMDQIKTSTKDENKA